MPTNTTTPEAATTTTPAANTNTTPLSAMTGEEVASILVGLIRQNDGVLIQQKVTDGINQSAAGAELSQGKAAIVAALQSVGITATTNDTLTILAAKMLQAIAIINTATFNEQPPYTLGEILTHINMVTGINDEKIIDVSTSLLPFTNLKYVRLPKYTSGILMNASTHLEHNIVALIIPSKLGDLRGGVLYYYTGSFVANIRSLRHIHGTSSATASGGPVSNFHIDKLYDYVPSHISPITVNTNVGLLNPTEALNSSSISICDHDEWDDPNEPQGGFSNNLQKFLWYFECHFIPCFGTVTTSPVLSLYTTVYNAINSATSIAQPTKTLKQLLTDKGWEVASVS